MKKEYKSKDLVLVFQPHQLRRVLEFYDEFVKVLGSVDQVYIYDIYTAREELSKLQEQLKLSQVKLEKIETVQEL